MNSVTVSAPGKIIIAGEHAVVYGYPALLAATDKRLRLTLHIKGDLPDLNTLRAQNLAHLIKVISKLSSVKKLDIKSEIPAGSGMGSSAALAVALSAAWHKLSSGKDGAHYDVINDQAFQLEKLQHGNPSGGDNTVVTYGGWLWFRKETSQIKVFKMLANVPTIDHLYLLDTGKPTENTGQMVQQVADLRERQPEKVTAAFEGMQQVARGWLEVMTSGNTKIVPDLIKQNHQHLLDIGVVSNRAKKIISQIEEAGGAAKITGAGGKSQGSGMLLVYHPQVEKLVKANVKDKLQSVEFSEQGVRYE